MPDFVDEVNEDLRADRARAALRRYGPLVLVLCALALVGTAAGVWWSDRRHAESEAAAARYLAAAPPTENALPASLDPAALASLRTLAGAPGPGGYPVLARLRLAGAAWAGGKRDEAHRLWREIAADPRAPKPFRDLAELCDIQHSLDTADPAALQSRLLPLIAPENPWRPLAEQTEALLDLRTGRRAEAVGIFKRLAADPSAPTGIRQMSQTLLEAASEPTTHP